MTSRGECRIPPPVRVMFLMILVPLALGCGSDAEAPLPAIAAPPGAIRWPASPQGLADDVTRCVDDYRELARAGLPAKPVGQPFALWYTGPFSAWSDRYNDVRGRCDDVFSAQAAGSASAQILVATQSYLHERLSEDATPYEAEPQMFVMGRYWSLGAACTYQNCADGPDRTWVDFCRTRARPLPPCPPIETPSE